MSKFEMPWIKAKRLKDEAKAESDKNTFTKQDEIGRELSRILIAAANDNKISNVFEDGTKSGIGPIAITMKTNNDGMYSIFPVMADATACCPMSFGGRGHIIYQIDVNLSIIGKELHFFEGPYGPDEFSWDISRLEEFTKLMENKVRTYTIFPRSA